MIRRKIWQNLISSDLGSGFLFGLSICAGGKISPLSLFPVDDAPDLVEELRSLVLVVQVVGVLPDVDTDDGYEEGADILNNILVGDGTIRE